MKNQFSRRLFLRNTAMATTGIALVSISSGLHALTFADSPFEGYNRYAECKTDLRTSFLFEKSVTVKGTLYDSTGNIPVSDAKIEVWHLSPGSTKYRHRGKMYTDNNGQYKFISDWPNRELGRQERIYILKYLKKILNTLQNSSLTILEHTFPVNIGRPTMFWAKRSCFQK